MTIPGPSTAALAALGARFTESAGTAGPPWRVTAPVPSSSRIEEAPASAPRLA